MKETRIQQITKKWLNENVQMLIERLEEKQKKTGLWFKVPDSYGMPRFNVTKQTDIVLGMSFVECKMVKGSKSFNINRANEGQQALLTQYNGSISVGFVKKGDKKSGVKDKLLNILIIPWEILIKKQTWTMDKLIKLAQTEKEAYHIYPVQSAQMILPEPSENLSNSQTSDSHLDKYDINMRES